ncbi:hypothetical protein D3C75_1338850 [compost metagenome]
MVVKLAFQLRFGVDQTVQLLPDIAELSHALVFRSLIRMLHHQLVQIQYGEIQTLGAAPGYEKKQG